MKNHVEEYVEDVVKLYLKEIGRYPLLTEEQEKELLKKKDGDDKVAAKKAKETLIQSNLRLVVSIAKGFSHHSHDLDFLDLVQEGNIGLIKSIIREYDMREAGFSLIKEYGLLKPSKIKYLEENFRGKGKKFEFEVIKFDK